MRVECIFPTLDWLSSLQTCKVQILTSDLSGSGEANVLFRRSDLDLLLVIPVTSRREERRLLNTGNTKRVDFLSQDVVRRETLYDEVQRYLHTDCWSFYVPNPDLPSFQDDRQVQFDSSLKDRMERSSGVESLRYSCLTWKPLPQGCVNTRCQEHTCGSHSLSTSFTLVYGLCGVITGDLRELAKWNLEVVQYM